MTQKELSSKLRGAFQTGEKDVKENLRLWVQYSDGKPIEGFRYYTGLPDDIGR